MNPMTKTILFDLGNTLINYHAGPRTDEELDFLGLTAMTEHLEHFGFQTSIEVLKSRFYDPWISIFPQRKSMKKEFDLTEALAPAFPVHDLDPDQVKALALAFHEPSARAAICDVGTEEILQAIRTVGLKIGLISNSAIPGYCHDRTLELLGLLPHIDFRLYSYDEGIRKPDPALFRRALNLTHASPDQAIMIGDSLSLDLEPAAALGIPIIQYIGMRTADGAPTIPQAFNLGSVRKIPEIESIIRRRFTAEENSK